MSYNQYSSYSLDPLNRPRFYGIYQGTVLDNTDFENKKRLTVIVPQVTGSDSLTFVRPSAPSGVFNYIQIPEVGAYVWVMFESGDPNYPVWMSSTTQVGPAGPGVPAGGTTGQVLAKINGTNYNTHWVTSSGSSGVSSVDGLTGAVTLSGTYLTQNNATSTYEPKITAGTTAQYFRGNKSLATFPTALSSFSNDTNFITSSALSPYLTSETATSTYAPLASPSLTGTPLTTTAAVDTNTTQVASTAFVLGQAASATPAMDGAAAVGTSTRYARADHVHGSDTTKANLTGANFTGAITTSGNITTSGTLNSSGDANVATTGGSLVVGTGLNSGTIQLFSGNTGAGATTLQSANATSVSNTLTFPTTTGTLLNTASSLDPAKLSSGTAGISISGNAGTVTNGVYTTTTSLPNVTSASALATVGTITSGTWNAGIVPVLYGGTGLSFNDKTLVGRGTQLAGVSGSATGGVMTNAFQDAGTPKYILVDAASVYYFEAYFPIQKTASTAASSWQVSVIYQDTSGTSLTPAYMYTAVNAWTSSTVETAVTSASANTAISFGSSGMTAVTRVMRLVGYITTHASTAGRMSIGFGQSQNYSSGTPSTPSTGANAFIAVYKMSTGSDSRVGNWV